MDDRRRRLDLLRLHFKPSSIIIEDKIHTIYSRNTRLLITSTQIPHATPPFTYNCRSLRMKEEARVRNLFYKKKKTTKHKNSEMSYKKIL